MKLSTLDRSTINESIVEDILFSIPMNFIFKTGLLECCFLVVEEMGAR